MPAHGARRGNLIYHWKHGWIPLDHFAALSKGHHSRTQAVKVMEKHGIDVPKGYKSDHKPSARVPHAEPLTPKAAANPVGKDHRAMSSAEKIRAAEIMHGTDSKQHVAAQAKFGSAPSVHTARATQLRETAAKKRAEADRIASSVGAPDRAGAMLRAKDSARMNARMDSGLRRFTEKQREAKALESKARLADGRAKSATEKQAASTLALTASRVSPGDLIAHKGQAHMVTKVNRTTVSVPSIVGGPWEDKLPVSQVSKHIKVADMKESTLRTLMSRAKGNAALEAVYAAELKRRGLPA